MTPTNEQIGIVETSLCMKPFGIIARAGTGKTTTARLIAAAQPLKRFLYVAFNKKVATQADGRFGRNVTISTAHRLAFRGFGYQLKDKIQTSIYAIGKHVEPWFADAAASAGISQDLDVALFATLETLNVFCTTADEAVGPEHVPEGAEVSPEVLADLAARLFRAMTDPSDSTPCTHDAYLKAWQLSRPRLPYDMILVDEGQDLSAAMIDIVVRSGIPFVLIGDPRQAIYSWRGAVNGFEILDLPTLTLTNSWRFGPSIANLANRILQAVGEEIGVIGRGGPSEILTNPIADPDAIIARTNGTLIGEAWTAVQAGARIHLVGKETIIPWARAAAMLHLYGRADHAAFRRFASWNVLREVAERPLGRAYKPFVDLAVDHGSALPALLDQVELAHTDDEDAADVTLASAHRFKGDEADAVRVANDFEPFISLDKRGRPEINHEEANLAYVVATRARARLDASAFLPVVNASLDVLGEEEDDSLLASAL